MARGRGEGTVVRRKDGRWAAALSLGPGKGRKWIYGKTRDEVAVRLAELVRSRRKGLPVRTRTPSLAAYLERWMTGLEELGRHAPKTVRVYRGVLERHVIPSLGTIKLAELSVGQVQELVNRKQRSAGARTAQQVREVLRNALNDAMREELIGRNVAALARPPRVPRREAGFWTAPEARRFIQVLADEPLRAAYMVGIGLGLRPSETLGLSWSDIDLEAGHLTIRRQLVREPGRAPTLGPVKTAGSRATLPLPSIVLEALRAHKARQAAELLRAGRKRRGDLVFMDAHGEPLTLDKFRYRFHRLVAAAGLPRIKLYDATRHTAASFLTAAGIHPRVGQQILRHADITTTLRIYQHVAPEVAWEAVDAIDRALQTEP
jgi:integrase